MYYNLGSGIGSYGKIYVIVSHKYTTTTINILLISIDVSPVHFFIPSNGANLVEGRAGLFFRWREQSSAISSSAKIHASFSTLKILYSGTTL